MKKITKITLVLLSSLALSFSAIAGELSVTGSVKASYTIGGASKEANKGLGVSNEFALGAAGELDNGMAWTYKMALDPSATTGTTNNDDQSLTLNTNGLGTVGVFITTGGLSKELGYGIGANGVGSDFASTMTMKYGEDVSNYHNIQYHTPADLLPFGIAAKVGYAPNLGNTTTTAADFKAQGSQNAATYGANATHYQITAAPIDGLGVGADYFETSGSKTKGQAPTSGNVYAKYSVGAFTVGAAKGYYDIGTATAIGAMQYNSQMLGVQFAVNDALSISVSEEDQEQRTAGADLTRTGLTSEVRSLQAAYNVGGATLGVTRQETDNADFTTGREETMTLLTVVMAF
jgi:hypothetical protein